MATKSKKQTKKSFINPETFERNLMIVLLVVFLASAGLLLMRNMNANTKTDISDPVVQERTEQE